MQYPLEHQVSCRPAGRCRAHARAVLRINRCFSALGILVFRFSRFSSLTAFFLS
jgi:hypothetical protein